MMNNDDYNVLAERLGFPGSARLCSILKILMTPEQAKLVVALPGSVAEVAAKTGVPEEEARKELDVLYYKGIIFPRGSFDDRDYYRFARHLIQLHDSTLANPDLDPQRDRDFFRLWHEFSLEESFPLMAGLFKVATTRITRVVPYYNAIKDLPGVLPVEDFHAILRAQDLIAVVPCSCRTRTTAVGEQCKVTAEAEKWHCLQFGRGAEYVLSRGTGRKLTAEEAIDLSDAIEKDGLIHRWANNADMSGVNTSCQCCRDCCEEYVAMDQAGVPVSVWWEKSRYQAYIPEADVCNACQACVDACQFDAIQMVDSEAGSGLIAVIDPESCFGCGACVVRCGPEAIRMKAVRPPEFIPGAAGAA
jgi:NAD-dependent dihydropyrimidine dehydrogenase PreA subunit